MSRPVCVLNVFYEVTWSFPVVPTLRYKCAFFKWILGQPQCGPATHGFFAINQEFNYWKFKKVNFIEFSKSFWFEWKRDILFAAMVWIRCWKYINVTLHLWTHEILTKIFFQRGIARISRTKYWKLHWIRYLCPPSCFAFSSSGSCFLCI